MLTKEFKFIILVCEVINDDVKTFCVQFWRDCCGQQGNGFWTPVRDLINSKWINQHRMTTVTLSPFSAAINTADVKCIYCSLKCENIAIVDKAFILKKIENCNI